VDCFDLDFAKKGDPMPRPFGVPNISKKDRATKTTRLAETACIQRKRHRATLKQFSWKPPTLFQNVGAATREFSNATFYVKKNNSEKVRAKKEETRKVKVRKKSTN
jgi:hypothetical protein